MQNPRVKLPSYRRHRASGQAVVTLAGRDVYLGLHGTKVSRDEYDRVIGEWLASGRTAARPADAPALTFMEMVNGFRKAVQPKRDDYRAVMVLLVRLYGRKPVADFGPLALQAVRLQMVAAGWKRNTINQRVYYIRKIFRWAISKEMIPADVLTALDCVTPLEAGETDAPESVPVEPVAAEHVEACLRFMSPLVQAMVRLHILTGMRSGELCTMRTGDINTSGKVWIYTPAQHKTKHLGKSREIAIGAQAQAFLQPYLLPDLQAFIFSPARATAERRALATANRKTPRSCGNRPGTNRVAKPKRTPGARYDATSYRNAIEYATAKAFPVPADLAKLKGETAAEWRVRLGERWGEVEVWQAKHHWHPHQLRHTFATGVRQQFEGLDHVQAALGQSTMRMAERYAKVNKAKAVEVAAAIG